MASYHFSVKAANYKGNRTSAINHCNYIEREGRFSEKKIEINDELIMDFFAKKEKSKLAKLEKDELAIKIFDDEKNQKSKTIAEVFDLSNHEMVYKECKLPSWAECNSKKFWREAEKRERINSCVYKELEFNLMNELSLDENLKIIHDLVNNTEMKNFYFSLAVHDKQTSAISGNRNLHCHLMFSEREIDGIERPVELFFKRHNSKNPNLGGAKKSKLFSDRKIGRETIKNLREEYANICNFYLAKNKINKKLDHRTLFEQKKQALAEGRFLDAKILDREPENHLGRKLANDVEILKDVKLMREINEQIFSKIKNLKTAQEKRKENDKKYTAVDVNKIFAIYLKILREKISSEEKDFLLLAKKIISTKDAKTIALDIATKGDYKKFRELAAKNCEKEKILSLKKQIVAYLAKPESKVYINKIMQGILNKNLPIKKQSEQKSKNLSKLKFELKEILSLKKAVLKQIDVDKKSKKNIFYTVKTSSSSISSGGGAATVNSININNAKILANAFAGNINLGNTIFKIVDDDYDEFKDNIAVNDADRLSQEGRDLE